MGQSGFYLALAGGRYVTLALAGLCAPPAFAGPGLARAVRWGLGSGGAALLVAALLTALSGNRSYPLALALSLLAQLVLCVTTALMAVLFRQAQRAAQAARLRSSVL